MKPLHILAQDTWVFTLAMILLIAITVYRDIKSESK